MRKFFAVLLIFLVGLSTICLAQIDEKKVELAKVREYIVTLDNKIKQARAARKINKISEIKEMKRRSLDRAKVLKAQIAALEGKKVKEVVVEEVVVKEKVVVVAAPIKIKRHNGWLGKATYGGGAANFTGGFLFPFRDDLDYILDGGLGIGSGYTIISGNAALVKLLGQNYAGVEMGLVNYSRTVTDILGLGGNVSSGLHIGLGIFGGTYIMDDYQVQMGYNTALGITLSVIRKF